MTTIVVIRTLLRFWRGIVFASTVIAVTGTAALGGESAVGVDSAAMGDVLFGTIERFHAGRAWGRFLDAGTGLHSLKWVQKLPTASWTAITADTNMKNQILRDAAVAQNMRANDAIVVRFFILYSSFLLPIFKQRLNRDVT